MCLTESPGIDKSLAVPPEEFARRQSAVWQALEQAGLDVGFVFSDEHYDGDVPYLGGNTNITIEQVAGAIGKNGFPPDRWSRRRLRIRATGLPRQCQSS